MRKLTLAINLASILGLIGLGWAYFSPVAAQCNGIFPPNTLCGNLNNTPGPPGAFSATTSVIGPGVSTSGYFATWGSTTGRVLSQSPRPWVTPQDFGAKGDGVTNDAPAINAAITTMASQANGGIVLLPCLTYAVTSTISLARGVSLEGACHGAHLFKFSDNVYNTRLLWTGSGKGPLLFTPNLYDSNVEHIAFDCSFICEAAIRSISPANAIWRDLDIQNIQTGSDLGFPSTGWYLTTVGGSLVSGGPANIDGNLFEWVSIHDVANNVIGMTFATSLAAGGGGCVTGAQGFTQNLFNFLHIDVSGNPSTIALESYGCSDTNTWVHPNLSGGASGSAVTLGVYSAAQDPTGDNYGNIFIGGSFGGGASLIQGKNSSNPNYFYATHVTNFTNSIVNNVDGNFKVCFNNCIQETGGTPFALAPTVTSCGTSPSVVAGSTNLAGVVVTGTASPTTCSLNFGVINDSFAFAQAPFCTVAWQGNLATMQFSVTTSGINFTQTATNNAQIHYNCAPTLGG